MAAALLVEPPLSPLTMAVTDPKPMRVCFSFAAYTKNLIHYLKSSDIPIEEGLTDAELSSIESTFNFTFPPDLRSILQEGLPVGPGFPNWRSSSSVQQLQALTSLPVSGVCKEISRNHLWLDSWGERPGDDDQAVNLGKGFMRNAPFLVPVYRHFYVPSTPCMAGNPVFYVHGGNVQLWSFDIAGFFQQAEFTTNEDILRRPTLSKLFSTPAWAATEPRRIEVWSELVERGERLAARGGTRRWWSGELGGCLEEVFWRLRNGGWKEEDVREMMMMDGCDETDDDHCTGRNGFDKNAALIDKEGIVWHVKVLSKRLLRGGWSGEDVMESLGFPEDYLGDPDPPPPDGDCWFEFRHDQKNNSNATTTKESQMNMHSIKA
ncbi:uncharacterized protein [Coffea arabica]|uniref:Knr4/Smi1-like domain-containing protein n=1 Tax=Coffea arabica TaxID=13443 RepID=A0A6P6TJL6_COFAR|nr:uncharacterized protein LOC113701969 [Coffea arabica]